MVGVIYWLELIEGKDWPVDAGPPELSHMGDTIGLILWMTGTTWFSDFVVMMESRFCVLRGIAELLPKGVYGTTLVKKHWYWLVGVPREQIDSDFERWAIGNVNALQVQCTGQHLNVFA